LLILLAVIGLAGCKKNNVTSVENEVLNTYLDLPDEPYNYANPPLPDFFNGQFVTYQNNTPDDNPVTQWGATLGRVLFYDVRLSANNTISCASCHIQQFGFTDTAQFSLGYEGGHTKRHSMALVNAVYYSNGRFFWDERASTLEEQVLMPIQDPVEMGMTLDELENKLRSISIYPILFKRAFGTADINRNSISRALAQFVRSLVSYQSRYDEGRMMVNDPKTDFPNFTAQENLGKTIFMANQVNCFGCHNTDVFITDNPRNNGIHINNDDPGVFIHTNDMRDMGSFKAPSLKNVAIRGRFMDDGSFTSLQSVIEHYNSGIKPNPNLDRHLIDPAGNPVKMNLTQGEVAAIKAFMETLTDEEIIKDKKFSSPFK
jgi:cytochrome c peroxidase